MSCETNSNKASRGAALAGGIHQIQSKATAVSATVANRILNVIDRDGLGAKMARNPLLGTADSVARYSPRVVKSAVIGGLVGTTAASTGPVGILALAGSLAAIYGASAYGQRLRAEKRGGPLEEIDLSGQSGKAGETADPQAVKVQVWPKQGDPASVIFHTPQNFTNWEKRGQTQGSQTVTRLKTTRRSGPEYYFEGELSNTEAVRIAAGALKAYQLPGYLGTVSEKEKLSPLWALSKRRLIMLSAKGNSDSAR